MYVSYFIFEIVQNSLETASIDGQKRKIFFGGGLAPPAPPKRSTGGGTFPGYNIEVLHFIGSGPHGVTLVNLARAAKDSAHNDFWRALNWPYM